MLLWGCSQLWPGLTRSPKPWALCHGALQGLVLCLQHSGMRSWILPVPVSAVFCCQRAGTESQGSWKAAALPDW